MYSAPHGQQSKRFIENEFLTTIRRICRKGLDGGKKAPVAQTSFCSQLKKKNVRTNVFFGQKMIVVFVILCYMAVLDAIPSREGRHFFKKKRC